MFKEEEQEEWRDDVVHALHIGRGRVPHRPHIQHSLHALEYFGAIRKCQNR